MGSRRVPAVGGVHRWSTNISSTRSTPDGRSPASTAGMVSPCATWTETATPSGWGRGSDEEHRPAHETAGGHRITHMAVEKSGHGRAKHLLTGLLRCEGCGSRMPSTGSSYSCVAKRRANPARRAPRRSGAVSNGTESWRDRLLRIQPSDPMLVVAAQRWLALTCLDGTAEIAATRAAAKAAESALQRLLADRQAGVYEGPAASPLQPDAGTGHARRGGDRQSVARSGAIPDGHLLPSGGDNRRKYVFSRGLTDRGVEEITNITGRGRRDGGEGGGDAEGIAVEEFGALQRAA